MMIFFNVCITVPNYTVRNLIFSIFFFYSNYFLLKMSSLLCVSSTVRCQVYSVYLLLYVIIIILIHKI